MPETETDSPESVRAMAEDMADCGFEDIEDALRRYAALLARLVPIPETDTERRD